MSQEGRDSNLEDWVEIKSKKRKGKRAGSALLPTRDNLVQTMRVDTQKQSGFRGETRSQPAPAVHLEIPQETDTASAV